MPATIDTYRLTKHFDDAAYCDTCGKETPDQLVVVSFSYGSHVSWTTCGMYYCVLSAQREAKSFRVSA